MQPGNPTPLSVNISQIPNDGLALQVDIAAEHLQLPQAVEGVEFQAPIHVQGSFTKVAEQFYFRGLVQGELTAPCSRCLETTESTFREEIGVVFLSPLAAAPQGDEDEQELKDEIDLYVHDGLKLDLEPAVYDHVMLALPIQPLCRSDCAGLCQVCGGNLNESSCACRVEQGDPRFAMLRQLSFPEST